MSKILTPSNKDSFSSGGTSDILPQERKKASFNILLMTNILDGGERMTAKRKFIMTPVIDKEHSGINDDTD